MHYYVITGGPLLSEAANSVVNGYVIAADAGIDFCIKHGIAPDLALGDMDSVSVSGLEKIKSSGVPVKIYPVEKDQTDTEIAVSLIPEGNKITVICPLSGRLDHVVANLQMAGTLHAKGRDITLDDGITIVRFLNGDESAIFSLDRWGDDSAVSLIPLISDRIITGVSTEGLYYPLDNAEIEFGKTLSFSNRPVKSAKTFKVSIREGLLGVVISRAD